MTTQTPAPRNEAPRRRTLPRGDDLSRPQQLMVFTLSMTLFGISNILLEVIPDVTLGPVDVSVSYFVFVPLAMVVLFNPFWAALGAPLGEIVFTDLLMGDFSGLAELEGWIQMFLALYIAGSLVRNPRNRVQLAAAAVVVVVIDKFLSAMVDLSKVWIGVEDAEYVEGLPESVLLLESVGFGVDIVMSGILMGVLPALWLIPRLHRKIEPLMGMEPREPGRPIQGSAPRNAAFVALAVLLSLVSFAFAFLEAYDLNPGAWEPDFLDRFGDGFLLVGVGAAVLVLVAATVWYRTTRREASDS